MRNRKSEIRNQKASEEPTDVEIAAMILTIGIWVWMILGCMGAF